MESGRQTQSILFNHCLVRCFIAPRHYMKIRLPNKLPANLLWLCFYFLAFVSFHARVWFSATLQLWMKMSDINVNWVWCTDNDTEPLGKKWRKERKKVKNWINTTWIDDTKLSFNFPRAQSFDTKK